MPTNRTRNSHENPEFYVFSIIFFFSLNRQIFGFSFIAPSLRLLLCKKKKDEEQATTPHRLASPGVRHFGFKILAPKKFVPCACVCHLGFMLIAHVNNLVLTLASYV